MSNLLTIIAALENKTPEDVEKDLSGLGYGALKDAAAEAVIKEIAPVQEKYKQIMADKDALNQILKENSERAYALARKTLRKVYKKVGLYQL